MRPATEPRRVGLLDGAKESIDFARGAAAEFRNSLGADAGRCELQGWRSRQLAARLLELGAARQDRYRRTRTGPTAPAAASLDRNVSGGARVAVAEGRRRQRAAHRIAGLR
jgi:uncharacterized protein YcbX